MKIEILKSLLVLVFALACAGIFIKKHIIENELLKDRKRYSLQACACTFQPGNLTGWGSEGVKARDPIKKVHIQVCILFLNVPRPPPPSRPRPPSPPPWHGVRRIGKIPTVCSGCSSMSAILVSPTPSSFRLRREPLCRYSRQTYDMVYGLQEINSKA